jgi:hypothetical protein
MSEQHPPAWDSDAYYVPTYGTALQTLGDKGIQVEEGWPPIAFAQLAAFGIKEGDEFTISTDGVTFSLYVGFGENRLPKPVAWAKWNDAGPLEWVAVDSPP